MKNPLINSKGFNTSPVMGFFRVIDDVLDNEHPTHLAVAFDGNVRPFRFKIYDQYIRPSVKRRLRIFWRRCRYQADFAGLPYSHFGGRFFGIRCGDQRYSYEADDIIGTISHKAAQLGYEVYMLTPEDYAQLLDDHVYMYRPRQGVVMM